MRIVVILEEWAGNRLAQMRRRANLKNNHQLLERSLSAAKKIQDMGDLGYTEVLVKNPKTGKAVALDLKLYDPS